MSTKKTTADFSEETKNEVITEDNLKTEQTDEKPVTAESEEKGKKKKDKAPDKTSEELTKVQNELSAEKERYLRLLAEYDNFRKRTQKERENLYSDVQADTVTKFLPIYDNLERAIKQETCDEAYGKGIEMIMTQFKEIISKLGVEEIDAAAGTVFDPTIHNAVLHIEDENLGAGVIAEEFQKGFRLGDKILRYSVVKVAN
ncbi:MAG: nucleotide exchange factor GrpE [Clostridiales bacterium]|jgi:molecular chaperone GrpE|nr:nucleotide exchange factor GrpE [Clostridiales bacterium]